MGTTSERSVQLLVVGAGPVGLVAGLAAVRAGLDVEIVDQTFRGWSRGYATLLHARSMQLFAELGVADQLRESGREISHVSLRVNGEDPVSLELPAPVLAISQGRIEEVLLKALRAANVELRTPYQATVIQQDGTSSRVRLVHRELATLGSPAHYSDWEPIDSSVVQADFVVGADGYDSRVRSALGIESAKVGELETFAMFEVPNDIGPSIQLAFQEGLASAAVPLPNGKTRLAFQIDSNLDADANPARLRELLQRAPWLPQELNEIEWSSVIHFERRLCRSFGAGRTWLAGDSAHITSPLGAQSMNLGLYEAFDVVHKVAACNAGKARLDLLQQYGAERQREWHKLLGFHVKYELLPNAPAWLGPHARRIGPVLPASGPELKQLLRQLGLLIT